MLASFTMLTMLNERLRIARKRARLTQQRAADAIGVTRTAVAHWEGGNSKPDHANLVAAAQAYGVTVEWLLDESGDIPVSQASGSAGHCDRDIIRLVSAALYQTLEMDGLAMEPSDFSALLLLLHDWCEEETRAGKAPDLERIRWFVRVARSYRRQ